MKLQMAAISLVSAMLGGLFGIAVWKKIDTSERDIDDVRRRGIDAVTRLGAVEMKADVAIGQLQDSNRRWWCSSVICYRDKPECEKTTVTNTRGAEATCEGTRIAFCPMGALNMLTCFPTRIRCEETARVFRDQNLRCVGVE